MASTYAFSDIIHSGCARVKCSKLGRLKPRWLVLKQRSSSGPQRIELYKNEEMLDEPRVVETVNITGVSKTCDRSVQVDTTGMTLQLCFDKEDECRIWLELLSRQRRSMIHDVILLPGHAALKHYSAPVIKNSLAVFNVYVLPTSTMSRSGEGLLQLNETSLSLHDVYDPSVVHVAWTLNTLRRYGSDSSSFSMETGRSSSTGEGIVVFNTTQGAEIYQKVHQATLALKSALSIAKTQQTERERLRSRHSSDL